MYNKIITPLVLVAVLFGFTALASAQDVPETDVQIDDHKISGYVWDATTETPLSEVEVKIEGTEVTATTDENGYFSFDNTIEDGEHTVKVKHDMYEEYETEVTVSDEPVNLNILLYRSE